MPGPCSHPQGGKSRFNRNKPKHPNRGADGQHKRGSENRNKNYGGRR